MLSLGLGSRLLIRQNRCHLAVLGINLWLDIRNIRIGSTHAVIQWGQFILSLVQDGIQLTHLLFIRILVLGQAVLFLSKFLLISLNLFRCRLKRIVKFIIIHIDSWLILLRIQNTLQICILQQNLKKWSILFWFINGLDSCLQRLILSLLICFRLFQIRFCRFNLLVCLLNLIRNCIQCR